MGKKFITVTFSVTLYGLFSIAVLWSQLSQAADETTCPWGLDSNAAISSFKKIKIDVEFSCPVKIDDPKNMVVAEKLRDFYSESLTVFSKEATLLEELAKRDFVRVLRFSNQTIKAPDYNVNSRVLTYGLFSNDAYTFGSSVANREDSIQLFKNLISAWNSLFKGKAIFPEDYLSKWGDQRRHREMVESLSSIKSEVEKSLNLFRNYDSMIKVVELNRFANFSNGYLMLDTTNSEKSGRVNEVLNLMKVYSKIPTSVSSKMAISCGLGCKQDYGFEYTLALSNIFDKIGNRWSQIATASPKVRSIVFNLGSNYPAGAFKYDGETKTLYMPVGSSGTFFEEDFVQSLDKLSKLQKP